MTTAAERVQRETRDLDDRDVAILDFERRQWRHAGAKEEAIREFFSLAPARYYQLLNVLIDTPAAVRHDPMLVRRLQQARDARVRARAARTFTSSSERDGDHRPSPNESID